MARYVVVNEGDKQTVQHWYGAENSGIFFSKQEANEACAEAIETYKQHFFVMLEMDYCRIYKPDTYKMIQEYKELKEFEKEERARVRASRKAWKAKQEAKKSQWLPGGILNFS